MTERRKKMDFTREDERKFERARRDYELLQRLRSRTEREAEEALLSVAFVQGRGRKIEKILLNA